MSDQAMPKREWRFYLQDMIRFAHNVQTYTEGLDQAAFVASGISYDATLRNLELIGEAATHVPEDVQTATCRHSLAFSDCDTQPSDPRLSWNR